MRNIVYSPRLNNQLKPIRQLELLNRLLKLLTLLTSSDQMLKLPQSQTSLKFLSNNLMLHPLPRLNINDRFIVLWDLVRSNDIVLALCQPRRSLRVWRLSRTGRMFEVEELLHKLLVRLLEEDLAEVDDDRAVVMGENHISGDAGLLGAQRLEGVGCHDIELGVLIREAQAA